MIVYDLICEQQGHRFPVWFQNSTLCDTQLAAQEISCPTCHSHQIAKAPMAPAVLGRRSASTDAPPPESQEPNTPAASASEPDPAARPTDPAKAAALQALAALCRRIEADCDHVGDRFASEARRIHYGEAKARGIYGEASPQEVRDLAEEGVEVARIPWVKLDS